MKPRSGVSAKTNSLGFLWRERERPMKLILPTLLVSLAAGLIGCIQKPAPVPAAVHGEIDANDPLAQRIAKDPIAVLQEGLDWYNHNVTSYICTLHKQERINPGGSMGLEQKLSCKFMDKPFSVYLEAVENPAGAKKVLYIDGKWDNKMLVQPAGLAVLLGHFLIDPHGSQAQAETLQGIDQFGFRKSIEKMIHDCQTARGEGIFTFRILGANTLAGRQVVVYDAKINEPKPTGRFEFPHIRVWLDREWLLPIAVDTWDAQGIQRGHYHYADVNFHAKLTPNDFLPETNGMKSPKEPVPAQPAGAK